MVDKKTVEKVADLARLHLAQDKVESIEKLFGKLLESFHEFQQVDTTGVVPMVTPHSIDVPLRGDKVDQELSTEKLLENAPETQDQLYRVPPVV